ncbi:MAG: FHA domain-containing protein [bacterium]|nr:FHA domain-containing protein [bacterium]MDT8395094.1 FHA domain-containing protein [bacterium]
MNICPECEVEMEEDRKLCVDCSGEAPLEKTSVEDLPGQNADSPSACLELEDGYRFDITGDEILLGRRDPLDDLDPEVDLSIHGGFERGVSRRHAVIRREDDAYVLEDLGSTNGTVLNREKVPAGEPMILTEGDVIHFGHLRVVFHGGTVNGGVS